MPSPTPSIKDYINSLPPERKKAIDDLRRVILKNLPEGFSEVMSYGMIGYVVPHALYAPGYHVNPALPLPFIGLASQKNYIALHHLAIYADNELLAWFKSEYPKHSKIKLDMGKGCIRFKKSDIPLELIGELASKLTVREWIEMYEREFAKKGVK